MADQRDNLIAASHGFLGDMSSALITHMGNTEPVAFFDNACGSGVLTQELQKRLGKDVLEKSTFLCADIAQNMVDLVKERVQAEGWLNTEVRLLDATKTGLPADSFTHIGLCMALNIIQDPDAVLADCKRILKPGGMLGATLPHPNGVFWTADMRSAFRSFPFPAPFPDTLPTQMHDQGHWSDQDWVINHLEEQGFKDVKVKAAIGTYYVKSAEHYVSTFGIMLGWFLTQWWDKETTEAHPVNEVRELIKKHLKEKYKGEGWEMEWMLLCVTGSIPSTAE
ncbi:hypothetical protein CH063_04131 [Colletotrichum higginsianum]|uniref:Coq5 family n=1 Tax=Colletotrichum higginsianum (strain IMI 349063) TaxID=759273 RepID=H1W4E1_COLHI|nr:Coq5 family [Colletotrichum higginsianum IMI 349063]OBR08049.1 Coq5 family [Colletotrichum higginsianum IMI 349063]CCF47354.1 hypothetical protein CH063_04131 [Colletotrichum higginsianum]